MDNRVIMRQAECSVCGGVVLGSDAGFVSVTITCGHDTTNARVLYLCEQHAVLLEAGLELAGGIGRLLNESNRR